MKWRSKLPESVIATLLWGAGMHFIFDWPRDEKLLGGMVGFLIIYWLLSNLLALAFNKGDKS